jgi:hypothetical protein
VGELLCPARALAMCMCVEEGCLGTTAQLFSSVEILDKDVHKSMRPSKPSFSCLKKNLLIFSHVPSDKLPKFSVTESV